MFFFERALFVGILSATRKWKRNKLTSGHESKSCSKKTAGTRCETLLLGIFFVIYPFCLTQRPVGTIHRPWISERLAFDLALQGEVFPRSEGVYTAEKFDHLTPWKSNENRVF